MLQHEIGAGDITYIWCNIPGVIVIEMLGKLLMWQSIHIVYSVVNDNIVLIVDIVTSVKQSMYK